MSCSNRIYSIVVTHNGIKWIERCLNSLVDSSCDTTIVVIDNGSSDLTASFIKFNFPDIQLIMTGKNIGFGQANNIGMRMAIDSGADHVFLLNQDAWVKKDTIKGLVDAQLENPVVGILSPMHLNGSGEALDAYFLDYLLHSDSKAFINSWILGKPPPSPIIHTEFVNAAAWLVSADCIKKTGGFDPIFFHYGEDRNYAHRAIYRGFDIGIHTRTWIHHDREDRISHPPDPASTMKREWIYFLACACDIRRPKYIPLLIRRSIYHCVHLLKSLFLYNKARLRYNFFMLNNILFSLQKIEKSRKISSIDGTMPHLANDQKIKSQPAG